MATSNEYRKSQDYMCQYIDECIEEKEDGKIKRTEVWENLSIGFQLMEMEHYLNQRIYIGIR